MTKPFHHTTIAQQYHALYSNDVFVRLNAWDAEQERQMRECMSNRDNYDLETVRQVVARWGRECPRSNGHRVAQQVLAEREAELQAGEIEALRAVIPHARQVGASETTISIDVLQVLLAAFDEKMNNQSASEEA
jgi:hypothetical protein